MLLLLRFFFQNPNSRDFLRFCRVRTFSRTMPYQLLECIEFMEIITACRLTAHVTRQCRNAKWQYCSTDEILSQR